MNPLAEIVLLYQGYRCKAEKDFAFAKSFFNETNPFGM